MADSQLVLQPSVGAQSATRQAHPVNGKSGQTRDSRRRLLVHHVPLGLASAVVVVLFTGLSPLSSGRVSMSQFVAATGYVALALLGLTLLIGPLNLLLRRRNPVSSYLRRDAGTWTATTSIVHTVLGFQAHGSGGLFGFVDFFVANGRPLTNSFGLGNWTGLAALVIVVGLLAMSTDRSMRELKARRWKNLQRLNYALFALVVLHAFLYGALLRLSSPRTLVLIFTVMTVFVGQVVGIFLWRRKHSRAVAQQA
jgi:sulfoxide reductase heme-binding subunit YedZ